MTAPAGRCLMWLAGVATAGAAVALAAIWLGLAPIAASSGHWEITNRVLHGTMRRTVIARALTVPVPPLDDPALVVRGARHYETGCAPCHGSPVDQPPVIPSAMAPDPPFLPPRMGRWDDAELFWIVKHGIKFTAMPAWPAQSRDDEVWAMTAFLRVLPNLDDEAYRRLAAAIEGHPADFTAGADAAVVGEAKFERVVASCRRCHGAETGGDAFPELAGQHAPYIRASLAAYAEGVRFSGIMQPIAAALEPETMHRLAAHFADLPGLEPAGSLGETDDSGRAIAEAGNPRTGVPACRHCHGPVEPWRNPRFPRLAGQNADYLAQQLRLFREDRRGGTAFAPIMATIAERLTDAEVAAVAAYYATLDGEGN